MSWLVLIFPLNPQKVIVAEQLVIMTDRNTIVHLVMYNVLMRDPDKEYMRWKEEICTFIDEYWDYFRPGKTRTPTWQNTIASCLSTNHKCFKSGTEKYGQPGYWTLRVMEPPLAVPTKGAAGGKSKTQKAKETPRGKEAKKKSSPLKRKMSDHPDSKDDVFEPSSSKGKLAKRIVPEEPAIKKENLRKRQKVEHAKSEPATPTLPLPRVRIRVATPKPVSPPRPRPRPINLPPPEPAPRSTEPEGVVEFSEAEPSSEEEAGQEEGEEEEEPSPLSRVYSDDPTNGDSHGSSSDVSMDSGLLSSDDEDYSEFLKPADSRRRPSVPSELIDTGSSVVSPLFGVTSPTKRIEPANVAARKNVGKGVGKGLFGRKAPTMPDSTLAFSAIVSELEDDEREPEQLKDETGVDAVKEEEQDVLGPEPSESAEGRFAGTIDDMDMSEYEASLGDDEEEPEEHVKAPVEKPQRPHPPRPKPPPPYTVLTPEEEFTALHRLESARKLGPSAARLRRKLHLRRMKRAMGLRVFNLDSIVSQSLRDTRPPPVRMPPVKPRTGVKLGDGTVVPLRVAGMEEERALDRFQAVRSITSTTYERSFMSRLYGDPFLADTLTVSHTIPSPYTGKALRPYIWRDYEARPPRKLMLESIHRLRKRYEPDWTPEPSAPIDYVYFQKMHLAHINEVLCRAFWPGIDGIVIKAYYPLGLYHKAEIQNFLLHSLGKPCMA
ncbi:Cysteine-rich protein 2-binding protein [Rhizophlyctis rosea]|uniref:Cysteine-rich protein 2-binding protein n=1 Tax=Rhizophlyctis rosea TaxID=64517 RepID=A0AAD5SHQ9_9FUNG|nr:Cysteine-rich protein 2-binding protein [Rhizophlyctis rosea]